MGSRTQRALNFSRKDGSRDAVGSFSADVQPFDYVGANLHRNLRTALARRDAVGYARTCLELGVTDRDNPDNDLFNLGILEIKSLDALDKIARFGDEMPEKKTVDLVNQPNRYEKPTIESKYKKLLQENRENTPGTNYPDCTEKMANNMAHAGYGGLNIPGGFLPFVDLIGKFPGNIFEAYKRELSKARRWEAKQEARKK